MGMSTNIQPTNAQQRKRAMPRVKVHRAADITLPEEARKKLGVSAGDELEVEVVEGGVLLRPVAEADRQQAWGRVFKAMESVRYVGPEPEPSEDELMEMVVEEIHAMRREHDKGGSR